MRVRSGRFNKLARSTKAIAVQVVQPWALHHRSLTLTKPCIFNHAFDNACCTAGVRAMCQSLLLLTPGLGDMQGRRSTTMAIVRYLALLEFPSGKALRCWQMDFI